MENAYLSEILPHILQGSAFTQEEVHRLQAALWQLLKIQTASYTMGESSSVTVEVAGELLQSLCFTLQLHLTHTGDFRALLTSEPSALLARAQQTLKREVGIGKLLLARAKDTAPALDSVSYQDTLNGIALFFKQYDLRFFAHQIPGEIDYQLAQPLPDSLEGIAYINEYLRRLCAENIFCSYFSAKHLDSLLQSISPEYGSLLINLFEPAAVNAIGLALLQKNVLGLNISAADRIELQALFRDKEQDSTLSLLALASKEVCRQLAIKDPLLQNYLLKTAQDIYPRLETATNLEGIFLAFYEQAEDELSPFFYDGPQLPSKCLAALICELQDSPCIPDKIALALRTLHSVADLAEVLNVCFWEQEASQLLETLAAETRQQLATFITRKPEGWHSETGWEKFLE